jgi:predicted nucleic acid-binding Zn ribbon protein
MPIYAYTHPKTGEEIEVVQGMNDTHEHIDEEGTKWDRVFSTPNMNLDSEVDPFSQADFVRTTGSKKGTMGEMMDLSKEMSQRRAEKNGGIDPVKVKADADYKKRTGRDAPKNKSRTYESKNVKVEY